MAGRGQTCSAPITAPSLSAVSASGAPRVRNAKVGPGVEVGLFLSGVLLFVT